jgi:hypothetical protein
MSTVSLFQYFKTVCCCLYLGNLLINIDEEEMKCLMGKK